MKKYILTEEDTGWETDGAALYLKKDDGSACPFFSRVDGEAIRHGEEEHETVSLFWHWLTEAAPCKGVSEVVRFCKDRKLPEQPFSMKAFKDNVSEEIEEARVAWEEEDDRAHTAEEITDIAVFCFDAVLKLGYDPELALQEVAKKINSRTGEFKDGKFRKDKSPEAQAKWYTTNMEIAKR